MGQKAEPLETGALLAAWIDLETATRNLGELIAASKTGTAEAVLGSSRRSLEKRLSDEQYLSLAKGLYACRQLIESRPAKTGLFGDPAWNILLDLFIAHMLGKCVCVTDTALAGNVPVTTALRWLSSLERTSLVERRRDHTDRRRSFVFLSGSGISYVKDILAEMSTLIAKAKLPR